jgi:hypothetical protein
MSNNLMQAWGRRRLLCHGSDCAEAEGGGRQQHSGISVSGVREQAGGRSSSIATPSIQPLTRQPALIPPCRAARHLKHAVLPQAPKLPVQTKTTTMHACLHHRWDGMHMHGRCCDQLDIHAGANIVQGPSGSKQLPQYSSSHIPFTWRLEASKYTYVTITTSTTSITCASALQPLTLLQQIHL